MSDAITYKKDIVAWASEQARLLRSGQLSALDIEHIAEEIEDVGKSEQRELMSRMAVLLAHLLKWQYQPRRRGASWLTTIRVQRKDIALALKDAPSLKAKLSESEWLSLVWDKALAQAQAETEPEVIEFPDTWIWSLEDALRDGWLPPELY
jgi:hypothetical protein